MRLEIQNRITSSFVLATWSSNMIIFKIFFLWAKKNAQNWKKIATFSRSVEGRTSSKALLDNWIAYPASLGVRTLTFSSLIYKTPRKSETQNQTHVKWFQHKLNFTKVKLNTKRITKASHLFLAAAMSLTCFNSESSLSLCIRITFRLWITGNKQNQTNQPNKQFNTTNW